MKEIRASFVSEYMLSSDGKQDVQDVLDGPQTLSLVSAEAVVRLRAGWEFDIVWAEIVEGEDLEAESGIIMNWAH
jgi:hypothetical protein